MPTGLTLRTRSEPGIDQFFCSLFFVSYQLSVKILKISWKDMVTNKAVREKSGQDTLESIIRERRLRWFGHVCRMDPNRQTRQVMDWIPSNFKRRRGRPRVSWTSAIKKDLELLGVTWEEALDLTGDRSEWRNCTARCATTARGRTKV